MTLVSFVEREKNHTLDAYGSLTNETKGVSYRLGLEDGQFGEQQLRILKTLRSFPDGLTNNEIRKYTGLSINAITGRMNELRKAGVVTGCGIRWNEQTNRPNAVWKAI